jgi:hypothetical protein
MSKVKPFCIHIQGMSYDQIEEILTKAVAAGGILEEDMQAKGNYPYFGLDGELETYFGSNPLYYSRGEEAAPVITLNQLDEHLGLTTKPPQKKIIMRDEITDMVNTAIVLEGLDKETVNAYITLCEDSVGKNITLKGSLLGMPYLELSNIGTGLCLYATTMLEDHTKIVTVEKKITYSVVPVERKTVTLFGSEYYEDMLQPMLEAMDEAKVVNVKPMAGGGTPPDKKIL